MTADVEATLRVPAPEAETASPAVQDALVGTLTIGGSFACWVLALRFADLTKLSGYGLITALPHVYFVGLALLTLGFAYAVARTPVRPALLGAYVLALVAQLHATTAILYQEPRYSWVYKHLGVVDYIQANGQVHRWIDIYNNWPGFFALTAWAAKAAGVEPIALAPWAQLFFELASVAAVVFALRGLTHDPRRVWTAAWLFVVANWVGQDYLSPQAFAFVLAVVALGLALRLAPRVGVRRTAIGDAIERIVGGGDGTALSVPGGSAARPAAVLAAGGVCALAVIVSHQLSPVFLILDLCALWLLTRRPSMVAIAVLAAAEVGWVALGWSFVSTHFNLFDVTSSVNARGAMPGHPLPGVAFGEQAATLSMGVFSLLALAGFVRSWRMGRRLVLPMALAATPFPLVAIQRYGGEGPLRAYLFALPWLALVVADLFTPAERARHGAARARPVLLVAATVAVSVTSMFGYFGQETLNLMTRDDVAASRWFLDHTAPGATAVLFAPNFPERVDRHYVDHLDAFQVLVKEPGVAGPEFAARGLPALERILRQDSTREEYVIVTPGQLNYLRYYGMAPPGGAAALTRSLEQSSDFELVYRTGASSIFRYRPSGGAS